jgi:hypothetical protein
MEDGRLIGVDFWRHFSDLRPAPRRTDPSPIYPTQRADSVIHCAYRDMSADGDIQTERYISGVDARYIWCDNTAGRPRNAPIAVANSIGPSSQLVQRAQHSFHRRVHL